MSVITKARTNEQRNFTLLVDGIVAGQVYAVYKTATQFHWFGTVSINTDKGEFVYKDAEAKSSKKFIIAAQAALDSYLVDNGAVLPKKEVLSEKESTDRRVKMINNGEGKPIPMSDLVRMVKLSAPKVTTEKLSDYDNTQSAEDKAILAD